MKKLVALSIAFVMLGTAQNTVVPVTVAPSPTPTVAASGNTMAGCPMYQSDMRISRDITTAAVSSSSASHISTVSTQWPSTHFGSMSDGDGYVLHLLPDGSSPVTAIHNEVNGQSYGSGSYTQTGHNPAYYPSNLPNYPIGQFTSQSALTDVAGDKPMEMLQQSGYSSSSGCGVYDGYFMTYIGTPGTYSASNMWAAYTACQSDPGGLMLSAVCNSNASLTGIEIAAGLFPEQLNQLSGWSGVNHALLMETPCNTSGNTATSPLCENMAKLRLRVCGETDYAVGGNASGANCITKPNQSTNPQGWAIVDAMEHYGILLSDNGCCMNIARHWKPQSGHASISFSAINPVITSISITDFDELTSNN